MKQRLEKVNIGKYATPGNPYTPEQLIQLIESSRNSGMLSMENAHEVIYNFLSPEDNHVQNQSPNS